MSFAIISAVRQLVLPPTPKHVLGCMAFYAADDGTRVYPSVATLAADTGFSERTVNRAVDWLKRKGILVVERYGRGGHRCTTHYRIVLDAFARFARAVADAAMPLWRAASTPPSCHDTPPSCPDNPDTLTGNQSGEPVNERGGGEAPPQGDAIEGEVIPPRDRIAPTAAEAAEVVQAFVVVRAATFGAGGDLRAPTDEDAETAAAWLNSGADLDLCRSVFRDVMGQGRKAGGDPPRVLRYCDKAVRRALRKRDRRDAAARAEAQAFISGGQDGQGRRTAAEQRGGDLRARFKAAIVAATVGTMGHR